FTLEINTWDVLTAVYNKKTILFDDDDINLPIPVFQPEDVSGRAAGTTMVVLDQFTELVHSYKTQITKPAWNTSFMEYETSYDFTSQTSAGTGVYVRPNGTNMYISSSSAIFQYTLSQAWNIGGASYASKTFSVSSQ